METPNYRFPSAIYNWTQEAGWPFKRPLQTRGKLCLINRRRSGIPIQALPGMFPLQLGPGRRKVNFGLTKKPEEVTEYFSRIAAAR
jgi:hypothetical protein